MKKNIPAPEEVKGYDELKKRLAKTKSNTKMTEEDYVEIIGNWNLLTVYTLTDLPDFEMTPESVSKRVGISKDEAERTIDTLIRIGGLEPTEKPNIYNPLPIHLDESIVPTADLLATFNRLSSFSKTKLTSKTVFGHVFEVMNPKVIVKYLPEIVSLIERITEESKSYDEKEVYSFEYSFVRATRKK